VDLRICRRADIGQANFDFRDRSGRDAAARVQDFGMFVAPNHDDLAARYETIHQAEQLRTTRFSTSPTTSAR